MKQTFEVISQFAILWLAAFGLLGATRELSHDTPWFVAYVFATALAVVGIAIEPTVRKLLAREGWIFRPLRAFTALALVGFAAAGTVVAMMALGVVPQLATDLSALPAGFGVAAGL